MDSNYLSLMFLLCLAYYITDSQHSALSHQGDFIVSCYVSHAVTFGLQKSDSGKYLLDCLQLILNV